MPSTLEVTARHIEGMRIDASNGIHTVSMDYPLKADQSLAGFTPLQLLLASLAGCTGNTLARLLQKLRQNVSGVEVHVCAQRRDEHPTVLTHVDVEFTIKGSSIDRTSVDEALAQAEKICPVLAMLRPGTDIAVNARIVETSGLGQADPCD